MSGVHGLDDVGRGVLRQLCVFRDQRARAENRPPFKVISNRALLTLSERRPQRLRDLQSVRGISRRMVNRYGRGLLAAIRRGASQPLSWAERVRPNNDSSGETNGRPSAACHARFEALRAWRNARAKARGVEPDLVLTNQMLWAVAHRNPRCHADLAGDGLLARWQVDEFGDDLLKVVRRGR
jgi:ribonuclease D